MTAQSITATEPVKVLPKALRITLDGIRTDVQLHAEIQVLNSESKIDRDRVFRIGRLPTEFTGYEMYDGNKRVATLTRDAKEWHFSYTGKDGKEVGGTMKRSETKRPKRKGQTSPSTELDNGPDLFMVVTHIAHEIWPDMKSTTRGGGGKRSKALREQLSAKDKQIIELLESLADAQGMTVEDLAKKMSIPLPDSYKQIQEAEAMDEEEEGEEVTAPATPAPASATNKGKGRK